MQLKTQKTRMHTDNGPITVPQYVCQGPLRRVALSMLTSAPCAQHNPCVLKIHSFLRLCKQRFTVTAYILQESQLFNFDYEFVDLCSFRLNTGTN